jgi:hypothetical protein
MGNLLAQLISNNVVLVKAANKEGNNYEDHDFIVSGFITATDALSNEWISSPAGELWLSELTKVKYTHVSNLTDGIRKAKKPIPQVDETHLRGYRMNSQFHKGIEISQYHQDVALLGTSLVCDKTPIEKVTADGIVCTQSA